MSNMQEGKVKSVLSGDTLILQNKARQERTLSLGFINAPRLQTDEPCSFESRDFLRKLVVGKVIRFNVLYSIPQKTGGSSRQYGHVTLSDGKQLPELIVQEGWAKLRDDADRKAEAPAAAELLEKLQALEAHAKADEKGVWSSKPSVVQNSRELPDPRAFVEEHKGEPIETVVERVLSGDRLIARLMLSPMRHIQTTILIAGLRSPATARPSKDGKEQPAEPYGNEAQAFVEDRLLQRGVQVRVLGVSPNDLLVGEVRHPVGNIAEFILKEGLARCVDHHSTLLGAEMGKLRQAERSAKEKQLGLWRDTVAQRTSGSEQEAVVSRVFSADTLFIRNKNGQEKRINLSSVRQPKPTDPKQSPFSAEAKEFLRKRTIGKHVKVTIDGKRPATEGYEEREMATVTTNGKNVALMLVENGYASVIRHRMNDTDDRSQVYDELLAAEEAAQSSQKGMWNVKAPTPLTYVDYSESLEKAKRQLPLFSRQKKVPAVVDFVKSGSRFTILVPRDGAKLTFVLGGIRAPRSARGPNDTAEPFGQEAHDFAVKRCMQRDCEIDVDDTDKQGGFIGTLFVNRESFAKVLVEEGLASVHAYSAEKSGNANELFAAEQKAKEARRGLWHDWDPSQDVAENGDNQDDTTATTDGVNGNGAVSPRERNYKDVTVTYIDPQTARLKLQMLGSGQANLQSLMKEFASFHLSSQNNQPLPQPPKAGDIVSAKFSQDNVWYRARVRRNDRENKTAEILYIDYGNSETQPWSALRALPQEKFGSSRLKPQAIDAALSFLQFPTSAEYLSDAVALLNDVTADRQLVANIDHTDARENNLLWVTLMDTTAGAIHESINAEVASEGLAMVPRKLRLFERAAPEIVSDLKKREAEAKSERRGMWEYGDLTED